MKRVINKVNVQHVINTGIRDYTKASVYIVKVAQYNVNGNFMNQYNSMTEASKMTGAKLSCISRACKDNRSTAGGYKLVCM